MTEKEDGTSKNMEYGTTFNTEKNLIKRSPSRWDTEKKQETGILCISYIQR